MPTKRFKRIGRYATGQTNRLTVLIGPRAHTISDKDLSGKYKSGG